VYLRTYVHLYAEDENVTASDLSALYAASSKWSGCRIAE